MRSRDQSPVATRQPRARRRWLAAVGIAAAGMLVIGTQTASAGPPKVPAPPCPDTCLVTPPPGEFLRDFTNDGAFVLGRNTVTKAKVALDIPLTLFHTYSYIDVLLNSTDIFSVDAFVTPRPGQSKPLGAFDPVHMSTLAFGSLPVTATLYLAQVQLKSGYLQPLKIADVTEVVNGVSTTHPTTVTGALTLRVADAKVDGTPLDLGPDCGTAKPIAINLTGNMPEYSGPVDGGILRGNANIGAFAGCGVGGDDLDPLLTGLFSGPTNPLIMAQGTLGTWKDPNICVLDPVKSPRGCLPPDPLPEPSQPAK